VDYNYQLGPFHKKWSDSRRTIPGWFWPLAILVIVVGIASAALAIWGVVWGILDIINNGASIWNIGVLTVAGAWLLGLVISKK